MIQTRDHSVVSPKESCKLFDHLDKTTT